VIELPAFGAASSTNSLFDGLPLGFPQGIDPSRQSFAPGGLRSLHLLIIDSNLRAHRSTASVLGQLPNSQGHCTQFFSTF
jgi:hypothetical protein